MGKEAENDLIPAGSIDVAKEDDNFDVDSLDATVDDKSGTASGDGDKGDAAPLIGDDANANGGDKSGEGDKSVSSDDPANADKSGGEGELDGKTPDELKSMIEDAKAFQGRQAQEIGDLRDQLRVLSDKVNAQPEPQKTDESSPEDRIKELASAFEKGTMPFEQVLLGAFQLGSDASRQAAAQEYDTRQQNDTFARTRDSYLQQNPDFMDMLNSGALDKIRQSAPGVHNDVSAYEFSKRQSVQQQLDDLTKEHERVKGELAAAQKAGVSPQQKVINQPGSGAPTPNKSRGKMSEAQGDDFLVDKLREFRSSKA